MLGYPGWIRKVNRFFLQLFACPIPEGQPSVAQASPVSEGRSPAPWPLGAPRHHRHQRGVRSKSAGSQGLEKWRLHQVNWDFCCMRSPFKQIQRLSEQKKTGDTYQNNDDLQVSKEGYNPLTNGITVRKWELVTTKKGF